MRTVTDFVKSPKDLLDKEDQVHVGDFVTVDDGCETVEVYVVHSIFGTTASVYCLELSEMKDDIYIREMTMPMAILLKMDESHINVDGVLWKVHQSVLNKTPIEIKKMLK